MFQPVPDSEAAYRGTDLKRFQGRIIDHRKRLNANFKKRKLKQTRVIIVHTSELGLANTLRVVSKGKRFKSGRSTPGGHAHYVIARDGRTYRTLDRRYRADHAGLSMWNGRSNVSDFSLGIELVGYHNAPISKAQYKSLGMLLHILKQVYGLKDRDVLTHSQVAYGRPNPWFKKNHRGRKRCAKNFERAKAGLGPSWTYDPDVRAGRLQADPILTAIFYSPLGKSVTAPPALAAKRTGSNIISITNSAWSIAGDEYNDPATVYILPDGKALPGDRVDKSMGWGNLPAGTRVLLNQVAEQVVVQAKNPIKTITGQMTAWSHAGADYRADSTIYFLPSGRTMVGSRIRDWDDLPAGTKLVVGYKGPYAVTLTRTAYKIAGKRYRDKAVVYRLPGGLLKPGNEIKDFNDLPKGVDIYIPLSFGS
ncbi:MAG: N-acetylmuramoyl-L-alanine amidase [Desulfobacterales bacterium]|nr:N-acetylmuramoyl-L-alanine amidase [Desulfobacterales bacterium]